jgi:uncharacterized protein
MRFAVRLTPKGGRDAIEGWIKGADGAKLLKVRVVVAPEAGRANKALIALLADVLGVARTAIRIAGGETARNKWIDVDGDADEIARRLERLGTAE